MSTTNDADSLYNRGMEGFRAHFNPGEKVKGAVTAITGNAVFVDIMAKSEGIIDRAEVTGEDGELTVSEGEEIEAFFVGIDRGEIILTLRMAARETDDADIVDAFNARIPVEGRVESETKGGFEVRVGSHRAFCPFSQIDQYPADDNSIYIGQRFTFLITEYDGDRNLVVSRRRHLEVENAARKQQLRDRLQEGAIVEGTVRRVKEFGAFVDLGGMDGLIPIGELAWERVEKAEDVVSPGDHVSVLVNRIDWERDRISLSLRKAAGDPWENVEEEFHATKAYAGTVTRLMPFGAFVMLKPGVEGLVHISKLGAGKRLGHPREVLAEGQDLEVYVASIDLERRRISLTLENPQQGRTVTVDGDALTVGAAVTGRVQDIKPYGIFVGITAAHTGLLHVSEIDLGGQANRHKAMYDTYPPGSEIAVVVKQIHEGKISLALPAAGDNAPEDFRQIMADEGSARLGSLGDVFGSLDL